MERDIKPTYDELESYVENLQKQLADAQATIAALEQRVKELKQWVQDQSTANLETMRHMDEMQSRAMDAESQLAQRTAELEAAKRLATNAQWQIDYVLDEAKKAFDLKGHYTPSDLVDCVLRPAASMLKKRDELKAELERVRDQYADLRKMVLALPKVEGEIAVKHTEVDLSGVWGITLNGYFTFQSALFDSKEEADAYAALLTHRQGME